MAATTTFSGYNAGLQVGNNSGSINAELHLPPERPETPPMPSSTVPFRRDPDFVDCGTLLEHIDEKVSASASRIALVGLGGVGKSQLLIEYSYQIRVRSSETWVFWVHASNAARFEQSFRQIADRVKVPGRRDPKANVLELVHNWLHDERNGKWVLMLDNLDDDRFLHKAPSTGRVESMHGENGDFAQPLFRYLPLSAHGPIIITTRSKEVARKVVDEGDIITVGPMDAIHARSLFEKKLVKQESQEDIMELSVALEFMPLAIVQAAAYINQRAPRSSAKKYLQDFGRNDRRKISLLYQEGGQLRRDYQAKSSIIVTWQISFDHLRQEMPSAANLLSLMSFFDRQGIADFLLQDRSESNNHSGGKNKTGQDMTIHDDETSAVESDANDQFEDDIVTLRNFSFITVSTDGTSFQMHRLVQLAMQNWLEEYGQTEHWRQHFIRNLCREFPDEGYETWKKCELIFPHAQSAVKHQPAEDNSLEKWAILLYNAAWFAMRKGNLFEAEDMAIRVLTARKKILGPLHPSTLESMNMVGMVLNARGRYQEAEVMHRRAFSGLEKELGIESPTTLASANGLGMVLINQGQYEEAEAIYRRHLSAYEQALGIEHFDTLASANNLASVLDLQGKHEEAEAIHRRNLTGYERMLGAEHPDTLICANNLGFVLARQGKYDEAEAMHRRDFAGNEKRLGIEHPDTLISINNLASVLEEQGRYEEAEAMNRQVLAGFEKVLGSEHPNTLTSVNNLGFMLAKKGNYEEAEAMHRRALTGFKKKLGAEHPSTLATIHFLKLVLENWKRSN